MDFLEETASNISNEIDDLMINIYFSGNLEIEKLYNDKMASLEYIIDNPDIFGKNSKDQHRLISNMKESLESLEQEKYSKIVEYMNSLWRFSLIKVSSQKNPAFTIFNPFFANKILDTGNSNAELQYQLSSKS
jgi:hypothetical protein